MDRIPQAKIASLFVVFGLVIVCKYYIHAPYFLIVLLLSSSCDGIDGADNKLLDVMPKHHVFYLMGMSYFLIFGLISLLLSHPTVGIANINSDPTRLLGWVSYCAIESFGSVVIQCYWALVNASVDVKFAKANFGFIVAGAQIGSIMGPTVATQADLIGIPMLYMIGALCMVSSYKICHFTFCS